MIDKTGPLDVDQAPNDRLKFVGSWKFTCRRQGKVVWQVDFKNSVVDAGVNDMFNTYFRGSAQHSTWYIGLVDNGSFSAFANSDTMLSHPGWTEFVGYSGGNRPTWPSIAASARTITDTTLVAFTITANGTLKGAFLTSDNTLSGTVGQLWAEGAFGSNQPVLIGDVVDVSYTLSA